MSFHIPGSTDPLFLHSPIPTAYLSLEGKFVRVNDAYCELLGYAEAELQQFKWRVITHQSDLGSERQMVQELRSGKRCHYSMVKRLLTKMNTVVWVTVSAQSVCCAEGRPLGFLCWAVPLPNHGKFKAIPAHDGKVVVRPIVKLGEFLLDNWKAVGGIAAAAAVGLYKLIRVLHQLMERNDITW